MTCMCGMCDCDDGWEVRGVMCVCDVHVCGVKNVCCVITREVQVQLTPRPYGSKAVQLEKCIPGIQEKALQKTTN